MTTPLNPDPPQCCRCVECKHVLVTRSAPPVGICSLIESIELPKAIRRVIWGEWPLFDGTDCPCFERREQS